MSSQGEMIAIALGALVTGVSMPLMVQLFLTTRSVQRSSAVVERRVEETHHALTELMKDLGRDRRPTDATSMIGAALVPAVIAAVRALRAPSPAVANGHAPATETHTQPHEEKVS